MDSKATTKEDHRDSTKGGISHRAQAGGIIQGTISISSKEVNQPGTPTKGWISMRRLVGLRRH